MGGSLPGATGMMYARTSGTTPEEPTQAKNGGRCWPGYKAVAGKTPFSKGSCQKAQNGRATLSQYKEPAWYEKAADYLASPMTALSYIVQGKDLPDRLPINVENRNPYDMAVDMINPAAWYAYAESADRNMSEGNYIDATFDALSAIPVIPAWLSKGKSVTKAGKNAIKKTAKSKSQIDWGKWNKEIPENKALMQEYNAIEQQAKADGTWMKNPDGSTFKGTPEQFVQQNSVNFKNAYGDGFEVTYRGGDINPELNTKYFKGSDVVFTTSDDYGAQVYNRTRNPYNSLSKTEKPPRGIVQLYMPKTSNKLTIDGHYEFGRRNYARINANQIEKTSKGKKILNDFKDYMSENHPDVDLNDRVMTDHLASFLNSPKGKSVDRVEFKKIIDGTIDPINVEVHNLHNKKQLKSMWGNNGMFDMTNPNIYKAIIPGAIGVGAASQIGPIQEDDEFKNGGWLDKYQDGGIIKAQKGAVFPIDGTDAEKRQWYKDNPQKETVSSYEEPNWFEKFVDRMASPFTNLGYGLRGEETPDKLPINMEERNPYDAILDTVNPFAWYKYLNQSGKDLQEGNYLDAGLNFVAAVPTVPAAIKYSKEAVKPFAGITTATPKKLKAVGVNNKPKNFKSEINSDDFSMPPGLLEKIKKSDEARKATEFLKQDLMDPETIRRAEALGVDPEIFEQARKNLTVTSDTGEKSWYNSPNLHINIDSNQIGTSSFNRMLEDVMSLGKSPNFTGNEIAAHETGHLFQDQNYWKKAYPHSIPSGNKKILDIQKRKDPDGYKKMIELWKDYSTRDTAPTKIDEMLGELTKRKDLVKVIDSDSRTAAQNLMYFKNATNRYGTAVDNSIERLPMFREYRQGMRDAGILKNKWDEITPEAIDAFYKLKPENRINSFMEMNDKNKKLLKDVGKIAPIGVGVASQTEFKNGGVIEDDRGQWAYPGEITKINSNNITMKGVNYPVLGISDTGDTQMMYPNGEYQYDGNSVTEYPMAKNGSLVALNQLTNFTNYNTPQPGGWLDKYN